MNWTKQDYVDAYEGGASIDDIAMMVGKSYTTIRYHLLRQNVKLRSRSAHLNPLTLDGVCHEGHDMKEHGWKDPNNYVYCKVCKNEKLKERYHSDDEFRETRLRRSRDSKREKNNGTASNHG